MIIYLDKLEILYTFYKRSNIFFFFILLMSDNSFPSSLSEDAILRVDGGLEYR
jgi:hypothetical protein